MCACVCVHTRVCVFVGGHLMGTHNYLVRSPHLTPILEINKLRRPAHSWAVAELFRARVYLTRRLRAFEVGVGGKPGGQRGAEAGDPLFVLLREGGSRAWGRGLEIWLESHFCLGPSLVFRKLTRSLWALLALCCAKSLQSCPALWHPMDCSLPGSSVRGDSPARSLEWAAMRSSRGSSQPRDRTQVSDVSCLGRWVLYHQSHLEALLVPARSPPLLWEGTPGPPP